MLLTRKDLMARPIEPTPVLKGKDAQNFLETMKTAPAPTKEHLAYLDRLAQKSTEMRSEPRRLVAYGQRSR